MNPTWHPRTAGAILLIPLFVGIAWSLWVRATGLPYGWTTSQAMLYVAQQVPILSGLFWMVVWIMLGWWLPEVGKGKLLMLTVFIATLGHVFWPQ